MARIGNLQKRHKALKELDVLVDQFGVGMRWACLDYVATGRMTPNLQAVWAEYVEWAKANEKTFGQRI